jgi:hypothetical protein
MILRENFHENKKGQYMNALISVISIILFIVLGIIIYNGLNGMDLKKKIIIFIFEIIVCLIFTMILFNISSLGIEYPNSQSREIALKILVTIFTPMNGIILLPNITRLINESQNGEIDKEECARKSKKTLIIFILLVIMEFVYLRNTQIGILNNYNMQN